MPLGGVVMSAPGDWADGVARVSAEAAGLVEVQVVMRKDMPELLGCALAGDPEALRLGHLVCDTLDRIERAPKRRPMLCGCCPRTLRRGRYSLAFAVPRRDAPQEALSLAICEGCATDHAGVMDKVHAALRRIWPDLRPLPGPIHPAEGRA